MAISLIRYLRGFNAGRRATMNGTAYRAAIGSAGQF
jgi:hypothetical protein